MCVSASALTVRGVHQNKTSIQLNACSLTQLRQPIGDGKGVRPLTILGSRTVLVLQLKVGQQVSIENRDGSDFWGRTCKV